MKCELVELVVALKLYGCGFESRGM